MRASPQWRSVRVTSRLSNVKTPSHTNVRQCVVNTYGLRMYIYVVRQVGVCNYLHYCAY